MPPTRSRTTSLAAVLAATAVAAAACGSSADEATPTSTTPDPTTTEQAETSSPATEATGDTEQSDETTSHFKTNKAFEKVDCSVMTNEIVVAEIFGDESIECGYVTVPANWENPEEDQIQIATYLIPSTSDSPAPDPIIYLEGGPGGSGVGMVGDFANGSASYLRQRGDVIVIDQRGTGYSIPALYCPETGEEDTDLSGHQACHDRLTDSGINMADYTSVNNSKDLDAVREAIGYDEWNLYGLSYGTRLALTAMRDNPAGIRSVILDSVFPIQVNGLSEAPYGGYWSIDQIAANCEADADCDVDAKALIEDGIARLIKSPIEAMDPGDYVGTLGESIAEPNLIKIITTIAQGSDAEINELMAAVSEEGQEEETPPLADVDPSFFPLVGDAIGMGYSVVCAEEAPYWDSKASPDLGSNFRQTTRDIIENSPPPFDPEACLVWYVPPAGQIAILPVTSDIPTLILAGTADIATPPAWSKLTGDTLANSTYLEFPGLPHGLIGNNDCLNGLTVQFLDDPMTDLDQTCVAEFPNVDYENN